MLVELDQRVAIRGRERGLCSNGVEQPRESIQDEVEVALGVFVAQAAEGSAIDLELGSAAVGNVDPAVPLRSELLGELQEGRVNVDGRLSDAELAKVNSQLQSLQQQEQSAQKLVGIENQRVQAGIDNPVLLTRAKLDEARTRMRWTTVANSDSTSAPDQPGSPHPS